MMERAGGDGRRRADLDAGTGTGLALSEAGAGAPVVLVHGIPGSSETWRAVGELLAGEHRVATADLLGFGASSRPASASSLQAPAQAEALAAALDRTRIRAATLVGHDFGGPVAAHLAATRPDLVGGLVWISGNAFPDTPVPFPLSLTRSPLLGRLAESVLLSRPALRLMLRRAARDGRVAPRPAIGDRSQARSIRSIFASALRELDERYAPVAAALSGLAVPAAVVWGDRDPFFPVEQARRTARLIPGAELVLLEGVGHFPPEERPREVAEVAARIAGRAGRDRRPRLEPRSP